MHLNTSFKKCFLLFFIFFINSFLIFSQDKSKTIEVSFSDNTQSLFSKSLSYKIAYKKTSPFVMLSGYTQDIAFNKEVFYRLKINNNWSNWQIFKKPHEGNDGDRIVLGEVFIEQMFDDIQFKSTGNSNFTFRLFFPEFTKNKVINSSEETINRDILSGCSQPAYQGRLDWCPSGNCPKASNPSAINPTHIVIHHSAADTTSSDFAAVVRGYWDYHVNTRGWSDIGYNWLVDPNGVLYEGRGDRIRGAHSPCMNAIATGICYIGNFETAQPAAAGLTMLKDFIAWDATDKNIDVLTSSQAGTLGVMDHISGHKDGKDLFPSSNCTATSCPGVNLHNLIPSIKIDVSNYACYISSANAPNIPKSFAVVSKTATSVDIKIKSVPTATKYGVYKSLDNVNYQKIIESSSTTITITGLTAGEVTYFKIEAINNDGVSDKSTPLAVITSATTSEFLLVDGLERRVFDVIKQYEYPMSELGRTFSSATNDAVQDGTVILNDFKFVIWMLVDESSADDTFNTTEQAKVENFIDNDGIFIVSGDEIGWDLVHKGDANDISFYENYLKAAYIADNPTPNNKRVKDLANNLYYLDDGTHGTFDADYPDVIKPKNGSVKSFTYDGVAESTGVAGVSYQTANGGVEYLGFALEIVYDDVERKNILDNIFQKYGAFLGVENTLIMQNIRLFPNPTNRKVFISNPTNISLKKLTVFTIYGQKLFTTKIPDTVIDLSNYANGIYYITIENTSGKRRTFKVIKK